MLGDTPEVFFAKSGVDLISAIGYATVGTCVRAANEAAARHAPPAAAATLGRLQRFKPGKIQTRHRLPRGRQPCPGAIGSGWEGLT